MKCVHPFPARMAPELASKELVFLPAGSKILDPMCGSGTTLRHAIDSGHLAVGWDIDPLAIKMARTWCRRFDVGRLTKQAADLKKMLDSETGNRPSRFSDCQETQNFIDFWFAKEQKNDLNRLSLAIEDAFPPGRTRDFFQIAMSRIVITKFKGASLAGDVSHSRPHKIRHVNEFETIPEFFKSVEYLTRLMEKNPSKRDARVRLGDCRKIMTREKFDAIITSPPYLNAIDYMRAHKFSLIWMGYTIPRLREIRNSSIGRENGLSELSGNNNHHDIAKEGCKGRIPSSSVEKCLLQYISDCEKTINAMRSLLKPAGKLVMVVANSNQRGTRISNSKIISILAGQAGFRLDNEIRRAISSRSRYLPIKNAGSRIVNRMKPSRYFSLLSLEAYRQRNLETWLRLICFFHPQHTCGVFVFLHGCLVNDQILWCP